MQLQREGELLLATAWYPMPHSHTLEALGAEFVGQMHWVDKKAAHGLVYPRLGHTIASDPPPGQ